MEQINLDLIPGKVKPVCHTSQYDIGRIIRLNLYMDGLPYTLTGTETISIMLRKSNFVVIIEEVTNTSSSYVEIETTENTCDVSGEYECELRVEDNEINIGSANFKMVVEPDAFDGQLTTGTASGIIANFYTSLEEDLVENKITFSAYQDEGTPTPSAPIPIVGVNKIKVIRTGKNLFNLNTAISGFIAANGVISSAGAITKEKTSDYVDVKDTSKYLTISLDYGTTQEGWGGFGWYDANKNFISRSATLQSSVTKLSISRKPPENAKYFRATLRTYDNNDIQVEITETQTATEYEPYNCATALIDLGSTYYGGALDVVARKMIIDKNIIVIDGSQAIAVASQSYIKPLSCDCYINNDEIYPRVAAQSQPDNFAYCDKLKPVKKTIWSVDGDINCMTINNRQIHLNIANELLGITDYTQETIETAKTKMQAFLQNNPVTVVFCIDPIIIDLAEENIYEVSGSTVQFETHMAKPMKTVETNFVFSQESGTPTPSAPIPIVGVDKIEVTRMGKNLFDKSKMVISTQRFVKYGVDNYSDTLPNGTFYLKANQAYTFTFSGENSTNFESFSVYNEAGTRVAVTYNNKKSTFTPASTGAYYLAFSISSANWGGTWDDYDIQLELGSTATEYEHYKGSTTLVNLGDTYYGGEVDVVSGKITLTHIGIKLSDAHLGWNSSNACFAVNKSVINCKTGTTQILKCSCYRYANTATTDLSIWQTNNGIRVRDDNYSNNLTAFLAAVGDQIMVYELDTPVEIYISDIAEILTIVGKNIVFTDVGDVRVEYYDAFAPNPIYITTLNGENNIYSDTNGNITVKYYKNIND